MKKDSIAYRVDLIVKECVGTQRGAKTAFAHRIGCTPGIVTHWIKGRSVPNDMFTKVIEKEFNINSKWLSSGEGDMFFPVHGDRNLLEPIQSVEIPDVTEDHPDYEISFPIVHLVQNENNLTLEFLNKARRLSRVAARNEFFLKLPFDLPQTEFKANNEITIRKTHFKNIVSGRPYLIECEKGVIASKAYVLRNGKILLHLTSSEDYVPDKITACYQILSLSESPFDYYEPTPEEEAQNNKIIRDYHNKEKAGKTLLLITESLLSLHFLLVALLTLISSMENGVPLPMWALFNGFMASVHLMIVSITKESVTEFCMTRWQKCFAQKFREIRYSF